MNIEEINSIIEMLEGTDISELEIKEEGKSIHIKKGKNEKEIIKNVTNTPAKQQFEGDVQPRNLEVAANSSETEIEKADENTEEILAPMVGTFYRSPAPDTDSFVQIGDVVEEGDTLCIIEAMKLMNEIEAETKGKIVEILVDDSEPIEYGQPLFVIEVL